MTKPKRLDGKMLPVKLTKRMETDISTYCRDKGIESESELVRQAISKYIYADYTDETLKLQGMKRIQENIAELRDMTAILFSYMQHMHTDSLAYHPEIDVRMADAAFASATNRHNKFFEAFQDSLKNAPDFFERLLHTYFSGEANGQG